MTADEWRLMAPLIPPAKRGHERTVNLREVINAATCVLGHRVASDPDGPAAVS
jgi:hypothetical protein